MHCFTAIPRFRACAVVACALAFFAAAPLRAAREFKHHAIDKALPGVEYGETALADLDKDGDLDFITGAKDAERTLYWFEYNGPDTWVRRVLGRDHPSDVGGRALDVDGDGWIDHVTGGAWYRNPHNPRESQFERFVFDKDLTGVHDVREGDLDGDKALDIVTMSDRNNVRWYRRPADPRQPWTRTDIGPSVHAGLAVGDLDGDGDNDVVRSNVWFENADGKGARWVEHPVPFGKPGEPFPLSTACVVADINADGRKDLVMTENEIRGGTIAWLENRDGKGRDWSVHVLPPGDTDPRGAYHSLAVCDFDNDKDLDVFTVEMEWIKGARQPRWFIWENVDGKGATFTERVILDNGLGGHEAVVGDVDGDGDLDICSKLWRPRADNANGGRNHADYLENRLIVLPAPPSLRVDP